MESESFGIIRIDEVLEALNGGEIIEEYADDRPYPSCLILGRTHAKRPLHIVCAPLSTEQRLIIITIYQPDPARWEADFKGRKAL
ncbi:MAG: DUF4258 domain-containing protein [Deltaproteobacteria bacterium]|nr:DUF4258 domain-containing protein [Deltaproteobacteria bacterium]